VVLHEARPVATWRGAAKGRRYEVAVTPLQGLTGSVRGEVEVEADRVARARGHRVVDVVQRSR
jgi:hypothetical protein